MSMLVAAAVCLQLASCSSADEHKGSIIKPTPDGDESGSGIEIGKVLPAWQEGEMDIHFINTTTGESAFIIMPDGTQLLIDAASSLVKTNSDGNTTNTGIRTRWDPTLTNTRGSEIIAAYLKKCMVWTGNNTIDYMVLTHFHNDHMGAYSSTMIPKASNGAYSLIGLPEILDGFRVTKIIDRGYPDYDYPFDMLTKASNWVSVKNYVDAVNWHVANSGLKAEIFKAGSESQIVPKTSKYDVRIRNIAVNGEIWTGAGTGTTKTFPEKADIVVADPENVKASDNCPPENICSAVMKISYGKFDYFAGADLQYNGRSSFDWKDAELPCAKVAGMVEVMKADHHGSANTNQTDALKALNPQTIIVNSWVDCHPRTSVMADMIKTLPNVDLFITNFWQGERPSGVDDKVTAEEASYVKGYDGNIVVRVVDGGNKYYIATTTDSDGKMTVKTVSGPYTSR